MDVMDGVMKILVTGGAGFIGSNFVRQMLRETDHKLINVDCLTYAGNKNSLVDIEEHDRYCFEKVDLRDEAATRAVFRRHCPDAVIHLAAESHVDRSIEGPRQFIETNIIGTFNVLQAAREIWLLKHGEDGVRESGKRFLHVSTDEVYGSLSEEESGFTEEHAYTPHSPYSASKASSDHLARAWCDTYGLPVMVTNCSNNYGPYQFPEKLIPVVILKCLRREPIPVYGSGQNIRDWLYVEDHCRALRLVLEKGSVGSTYNIGGNNEMRNIDLVRAICQIVDELMDRPDDEDSESLITFVADRPGHDHRYVIDATKIKNTLGWQPSGDPSSLLRQTVEWYLENRSWWEAILNGSYRLDRQGLLGEE